MVATYRCSKCGQSGHNRLGCGKTATTVGKVPSAVAAPPQHPKRAAAANKSRVGGEKNLNSSENIAGKNKKSSAKSREHSNKPAYVQFDVKPDGTRPYFTYRTADGKNFQMLVDLTQEDYTLFEGDDTGEQVPLSVFVGKLEKFAEKYDNPVVTFDTYQLEEYGYDYGAGVVGISVQGWRNLSDAENTKVRQKYERKTAAEARKREKAKEHRRKEKHAAQEREEKLYEKLKKKFGNHMNSHKNIACSCG